MDSQLGRAHCHQHVALPVFGVVILARQDRLTNARGPFRSPVIEFASDSLNEKASISQVANHLAALVAVHYRHLLTLTRKGNLMRTMAPRATTISIILSLLFLSPVTLMAQTGLSDWSRLSSVASGSKLSVKLKDGKTVEGSLRSVSDTGLSLTVKNADRELRRDDVLTVHELAAKSVTKSTLIGLGVGAGAGAAIGIAGDASGHDNGFEKIDNTVAAGVAVLGAGVGALSGFLIGRSGKKRVLLYESK